MTVHMFAKRAGERRKANKVQGLRFKATRIILNVPTKRITLPRIYDLRYIFHAQKLRSIKRKEFRV